MNICPHCRADPCLPLWRRLILGPSATARCQECGHRVRVDSKRAWLAASPLLLLIVLISTGVLQDALVAAILLPLCLALTFITDALWVPLKWDEFTGPAMVEAGRARIAAEKAAKAGKKGANRSPSKPQDHNE
jgi:hypothetical protein